VRIGLLSFLIVIFVSCTNGIMNVGIAPFNPLDTETETVVDTASDGADAGDRCGIGGVWYQNLCWFLGEFYESCIDVCTGRGGYDETAASIIGTPDQNGTWAACRDIVRLMGYTGEVAAGYRSEGPGLGCHIWDNGEIWWLYSPDFDPASSISSASMVCGCKAD
jgi:hypothetical protein